MKNNLTELVMILDRSGSMSGLESDTIGGYNSMLDKQRKEDGEVLVSTVLFDDQLELLHDRVPLSKLKKMTEDEYYVRGCTALLDAIGCTVTRIRNIHKRLRPEDRPAKTIFVITTDGLENASCKFHFEQVSRMVQQQIEAGWEFLFFGANIDAIEAAGMVGIDESHAVNYCADSEGTELQYEVLGDAICSMRCTVGGDLDASWKAALEEDVKRRGKKGGNVE